MNNIPDLLDRLQDFYDKYDALSIRPNNTTHFLEFFKEKNLTILSSFMNQVTKESHSNDTFNADNIHIEISTENQLIEIEKTEQKNNEFDGKTTYLDKIIKCLDEEISYFNKQSK